jgi:hypothetical protein
MESELSSLLSVDISEVSGLLKEFGPVARVKCDGICIHFHYIRFQNNTPRINPFINKLCNHIVNFCLKRDKLKNVKTSQYRQLYKEAKLKFAQPKGAKTGEPGELILFFLLEGYARVPKIFSKMSLKTNNQMHVHGSDGVHLGINGQKLVLHFGESKLYSVHTTGISEALSSVKDFVGTLGGSSIDTQDEFEISVLTDNLDIPPGPLRNRVMDALDPYSAARDDLEYIHSCFIGFDLGELTDSCNIEDFEIAYEKKAESCYQNVLDKINKDPVLRSLSWQFFFIPFGSVDSFRKKFIDELNSV